MGSGIGTSGRPKRPLHIWRGLFHAVLILFLTIVTQVGGLAWLMTLFFRRKLLVFFAAYLLLWTASIGLAPQFERTPLHCWNDGPLQMQSWFYCATGRNYMSPELLSALQDTAVKLEAELPGTKLQVLDANFPFFDGFPLLPHLSHDDGDKVDLAFFYQKNSESLGTRTKSPIGYFAFEDGPTHCPAQWPTLRWDLRALQRVWPDWQLDELRTGRTVELLLADGRISKIFIEPHIADRFNLTHPKIRFQGCRAARHDDHIHVQL